MGDLGRDRGPRRPREQPPQHQPRHPEAPADGVHRRFGLGQELARVRHDRRRVAAADQRDLQRLRAGLHADAGPARRRLARGADDRDHPRPGADGRQRPLDRRHRHRRQRDAAGRLQPARAAAHRRAPGVLVQRPVGHAAAARSRSSAARARPRAELQRRRRHVPALRGHGQRERHRPDPALRRDEVARRGRDHRPRLHARTAGRRGCSASPASSTRTSRSATTPRRELHDFLYKEPCKVKINGINLTYEGLVPRIQKSFLSKDVDALQPHIRAFVERAVTFSSCPDCGGTRLNEAARSSKIDGHQHRRRLRDADQRPGRVGARPRRAVGGAAAGGARGEPRLVRRDGARLPAASTGRRARSRAARRSARG